jgi:hypothetical protein
MALVSCTTTQGLRDSEVTAIITDFDGRREFLPVDREFLSKIDGRWYMPIGLLRVDEAQHAALIQLSTEADSGANRFWVRLQDIYQAPHCHTAP